MSESHGSILRQCLKLQQVIYRLLTEHRTGVQYDLLRMDLNVCLPLSRLDFNMNYMKIFSSYRAVNALPLRCKNQSVNAV